MRTRGCRQKDVRGETGRDTRSDGGGENTTSAVRATAKRFSSTNVRAHPRPFSERVDGRRVQRDVGPSALLSSTQEPLLRSVH